MAGPQNPSPQLSSSRVFRTAWLLWLVIAAAMIILGLTLPRWWFHLTRLPLPSSAPQEQITPSADVVAVAPPRLVAVIAGIVLVWAAAAWIMVWRKSRNRWPSSQTPFPRCRVTELVLPCGCWLQLIHVGERRLLAGHDRTGVRVLLELPPTPTESETGVAGVSEAAPRLSSPLPEPGTTDARAASILALFQQLKAATQASS